MGDVICKFCGEPWMYYTLKHDLPDGENVLAGEGCPSCDWGSQVKSPEFIEEWRYSVETDTDLDVTQFL